MLPFDLATWSSEIGLCAMLVLHGVFLLVMKRNDSVTNVTVWTAVSVGYTAAWIYLLHDAFPWGHVTARTALSGSCKISQHVPQYFMLSDIMFKYYVISAFLTGAASWTWLAHHVWMVGWLRFQVSQTDTSLTAILLLARCFRYQVWLCATDIWSLPGELDSEAHPTPHWLLVICHVIRAFLYCWLVAAVYEDRHVLFAGVS